MLKKSPEKDWLNIVKKKDLFGIQTKSVNMFAQNIHVNRNLIQRWIKNQRTGTFDQLTNV